MSKARSLAEFIANQPDPKTDPLLKLIEAKLGPIPDPSPDDLRWSLKALDNRLSWRYGNDYSDKVMTSMIQGLLNLARISDEECELRLSDR